MFNKENLLKALVLGLFLIGSCATGPTTTGKAEVDVKPVEKELKDVKEANGEISVLRRDSPAMTESQIRSKTKHFEAGKAGEGRIHFQQSPKVTVHDGLGHLRFAPPGTGNTENYDPIQANTFMSVEWNPLSTFSIDVDTASYANVRRFLNQGQLPPKDAVRIEEMVNYFTYNYPAPADKPFSVSTEVGVCPWDAGHYLMQVGIQGKNIAKESLPPANLVFLIDVSGSMNDPNKLPLLIKAFTLLTGELRSQDRVAIAVYAGRAGLVLPSTSGSDKLKIREALEKLEAGGSTAGGEGIILAYETAKKNFLPKGNNRVILATDGDFNVGMSSDGDLVQLIEEKRKSGIFLSVLGFGMGNYKDSKMEKLADKGNGNYAYIDNLKEAEKVLVTQMGGTLFTIAKDVKIQVEFNPAQVKGYRLIGYENRLLKNEDFNNDKIDAGDIGAGHTVTALYEIIPASSKEVLPTPDGLKYQKTKTVVNAGNVEVTSAEMATVKLRYKEPKEDISKLVEKTVTLGDLKETASENLSFASAVAAFGLILRGDEKKGDATYEKVLALGKSSKGADLHGYRAEFLKLVASAKTMVLAKL